MTKRLRELLGKKEWENVEKRQQPTRLKPMLATLTHDQFSDADWIFERKLDGERVLAFRSGGEVRLLTRNAKNINDSYPEIAEALENPQGVDLIVDGEIVAFSGRVTSFSRLQKRMQISDPDKARASGVKVYCYLFDILQADGYALEALPLRSRKKVLKKLVEFGGSLRYTAHRNAKGEAYFSEACEKGWEGLIAKRADSKYRHSRSRDWLKFKCQKGQELVIGGFTEPKGGRVGFGALLVGYYEGDDLCYAGKVGTGYDDEFLRDFRKRLERISRKTSPFSGEVDESGQLTWVKPHFVGEFGFTEWTESGKLRHPRFLGLRRDKEAREVKRES